MNVHGMTEWNGLFGLRKLGESSALEERERGNEQKN